MKTNAMNKNIVVNIELMMAKKEFYKTLKIENPKLTETYKIVLSHYHHSKLDYNFDNKVLAWYREENNKIPKVISKFITKYLNDNMTKDEIITVLSDLSKNSKTGLEVLVNFPKHEIIKNAYFDKYFDNNLIPKYLEIMQSEIT